MKKPIFLLLSLFFFTIYSCTDKDDSAIAIDRDVMIQDFIWKNLNLWYFWQEQVPKLADNAFSSRNAYIDYLKEYPNPKDLFDALQHPTDKFSYITDNYNNLLNTLQGVSTSNGLVFGLAKFSDSNGVYGYVRYVLPNSSASAKAIKRGEIFTAVDGQKLNTTNYRTLLFSNKNTYTLQMARLKDDAGITDNLLLEKDVIKTYTTTLEQQQLQENPIQLHKTISLNNTKIGYLLYNAFTANFDKNLQEVFSSFKTQGINELVLDLRYNTGGSINSAAKLASMITGQFNGEVFIKERWNTKIQPILKQEDIIRKFGNTYNGQSIPQLNLSRLYVLTSKETASASELIINGLSPYINVIQIGDTTTGKNQGSITIFDYIEKGVRNPNHTWAMQPLVLQLENSKGFSEYQNGIAPDIFLPENLANLAILGNTTEPLLAKALADITTVVAKPNTSRYIGIDNIANNKNNAFLKNTMYTTLK